ncbi:metalloregulator ArsR/SmtB family transcription factor [Acidihalobacter prosperus]|uniref:ArsR family transcriptional regulator n=1 Tax=Acidihalobacter prosperus TaxID=160660 RepID=A0A1A6BZZ5_9GAMM|nr:metalloregulator ArsR/SmtB family transcription factor [Acidihalobacter prosperus]OBS07879.1 ArsR family transcriptional regulator [Acidihalobacter prosperus]
MTEREIKDLLYAQVARIGKAVASPKRLELIELLAQAEKSVDQLAAEAEISIKLASAHLKELRQARLVETRREGKRVFYRLADHSVADFWVSIRSLAEAHLLELKNALARMSEQAAELTPINRTQMFELARRGDVVVLDVRPETEFAAGHLPYALSMPLAEVRKRLAELPHDKPIVAYCRGPFCVMAKEAVTLLSREGYRATRIEDGVAEWRAQGLPVEARLCPVFDD